MATTTVSQAGPAQFTLGPPKIPHATAGVLFIGLDIAAIIYGVTCLQMISYYKRFPKDPRWVKLGVAFVWMIETLNTCLVVHTLFHYLILDRTPSVFLRPPPWSLGIQASLNSTLSSVIHVLLGWRIWILSNRRKSLMFLIGFLSLGQFMFGLATTISSLDRSFISDRNARRIVVLCAFSLTAGADIIVAALLCFFLHLRKTSNKRSTGIINHIIVLTINNGILSSSIALLALITILAIPQIWLTYAACFTLGKAYFNTLLSTLNARKGLREKLSEAGAEPGIGTETIQRRFDNVKDIPDMFEEIKERPTYECERPSSSSSMRTDLTLLHPHCILPKLHYKEHYHHHLDVSDVSDRMTLTDQRPISSLSARLSASSGMSGFSGLTLKICTDADYRFSPSYGYRARSNSNASGSGSDYLEVPFSAVSSDSTLRPDSPRESDGGDLEKGKEIERDLDSENQVTAYTPQDTQEELEERVSKSMRSLV